MIRISKLKYIGDGRKVEAFVELAEDGQVVGRDVAIASEVEDAVYLAIARALRVSLPWRVVDIVADKAPCNSFRATATLAYGDRIVTATDYRAKRSDAKYAAFILAISKL